MTWKSTGTGFDGSPIWEPREEPTAPKRGSARGSVFSTSLGTPARVPYKLDADGRGVIELDTPSAEPFLLPIQIGESISNFIRIHQRRQSQIHHLVKLLELC